MECQRLGPTWRHPESDEWVTQRYNDNDNYVTSAHIQNVQAMIGSGQK